MTENWKSVPGYPDYEVSDTGRVRSKKRGKERILVPIFTSIGYPAVNLYRNGKSKLKTVHLIMAISFLGHKSNGHRLVVDHINNIPSDNRLENLQIITHRKNSSKDRKGGSSKFVGVYWDKQMSKWRARIYLKGKSKHLGLFDSEKEAANAYQLVLTNIK